MVKLAVDLVTFLGYERRITNMQRILFDAYTHYVLQKIIDCSMDNPAIRTNSSPKATLKKRVKTEE